MRQRHPGSVLARVLLCALPLAGLPGWAAEVDPRDAEIARLRDRLEQAIARIEALEAERRPAAAPAPVTPTPSSTPVAPAAELRPAALVLVIERSALPAHHTFDEDEQDAARANNELPPGVPGPEGFFLLPGTSTWLRLGGYAKVDGMFDSDDAGYSDMFITSTIPVGGQGGQSSFNMHARQSRFTLEARRETSLGSLRILLQNDFFGPGGSYGYNLRHAWGQLGNTYAGYGWSAFMDLDSGPDTLDFAGPGVVPFGRVTSIRQYVPLGSGNQLIFAAEHAPPEITSVIGGARSRTTAPSLVAVMRHEGGAGHLQASTMLRQLAYEGSAGSDEAMAGGLALSGSWGGGSGYLTGGLIGGRGIAAYIGDLLGLGLDGVVDTSGSLDALDEWGGWIGYTHPWNADWRSTLTGGRLYLERNASLSQQAFRRSDYLAANLIYSPSSSWSWGVEVLYGALESQGGDEGDVMRLQASLKYDFFQ
jgi:hypothetical protein